MRRAARGAAIATLGLLGACTEPNPYLPAAEGSSSGSGTTSGTADGTATTNGTADATAGDDPSSGGGPQSCADRGMTCIAVAPAGWQGPAAWLERPADAPIDCPAPFETQTVEAFSELSAPAASCECNCGPLTNAGCPVVLERYVGNGCAGGVDDTLELEPNCTSVINLGWNESASYVFDAPTMTEGGCIPFLDADLPPATFLTRHLACSAPLAAEGCAAGSLCAPPPEDPFNPRWCVWQEGDVACPAEGGYVDRTLLYRGIDDQRGCEPCTCTPPRGSCPGAEVVLSGSGSCSSQTATLAPGQCVNVASAIDGVDLAAPTVPGGECDPAVVVPTGEAAGIDPVTFCCTG